MTESDDIEDGNFIINAISSKVYIGNERTSGRQVGSSTKRDPEAKNRNWIHVVVFLLCCGLSAGVGYAAYVLQLAPQMATFLSQRDSTVYLVTNSIRLSLENKVASTRLLGKIYQQYSDDETFPEVILPGYATVANDLLTLGSFTQLYWMPMVNATTLPQFKSYAKKNIQNLGSNITSTIQLINKTLNTYGPYHVDTTGALIKDTIPISTANPRFNQWLFPVLQMMNLNRPVDTTAAGFFFDPHSTLLGGRQAAMDRALDTSNCAFTDFLVTREDIADGTARPASIFYSPVYSLSSKDLILGMVGADTYWDTTLLNSLPSNSQRVDCVLSSKTSTWTISIDQGKIIVYGLEGDHHDASMTAYGQSVSLDLTLGGTVSASDFTITIYPSSAYYNQYITTQPYHTAIAVGVVIFVCFLALYAGRVFVQKQKERIRKKVWRLKQSQAEAKLAEAEAAANAVEAEKEKDAKEREMQLTKGLNENIANTAHDMKSPACALSLAVGSMISTFHGKTRVDRDGCKFAMDTLTGMMHTLSSLNTIINRSVDAASKITGNLLVPNMGLIEVRALVNDVMVFMRWQSEHSSLTVTLEPFPDNLPVDIWADLKWLREDLLCVAANALKFSQESSRAPVIVRVTTDAVDDDLTTLGDKKDDEDMPKDPIVCFSFIDSGHNLSKEQLSTLFDYPKFGGTERIGLGGMGLGLYCLHERVTAVGGRCGARVRRDGYQGTEIWFCIPLLDADAHVKSYELQPHENSQPPVLSPQELEMIAKKATAVENSLTRRMSTNFVTALGGAPRSSASISAPSVPGDQTPPNHGSFAIELSRSTPVPSGKRKSSKSSRGIRKSMDVNPISSLQQSLDKISKIKGGTTLPILIVDDSITILKMMKKSFNNELPDVVIKEARDGHEAFDRVQEETNGFHVIITDIQMPNCDGFDFTYRVREHEDRNRLPRTMIVGMSANYQEKFIMESHNCGMDGFMHKPFQLQTLMDVINHVQLHRDLTEELERQNLVRLPYCDFDSL